MHPSKVDTDLLCDECSGLALSGLDKEDPVASTVYCGIAVDSSFECDLTMWTSAARAS